MMHPRCSGSGGRRRMERSLPGAALTALAVVLCSAGGCEESANRPAPAPAPKVEASPMAAEPDSAVKPAPEIVSTPQRPARAATVEATTRPAVVGSPPIQLDPPTLDFGYMKPKESIPATVQIRNIGSVPVKILRATASCKCTTLSNVAGVVIPPGGSVPLIAQFEARAMAGPMRASVDLVFEGYDESVSVRLTGEVSMPLKAAPFGLNLVRGDWSGEVVIESLDGRPFSILAADRKEPRFIGFDPEIDELRNSYTIEWDLTQYTEQTLPNWWIVETDHPDCPLLDLWVRHISNMDLPGGRPWRLKDRRAVLGVLAPGDSAEFTVSVEKLGRDEISAVISLSRHFDAELIDVQRRGDEVECTVRITPKVGSLGLLTGQVKFIAEVFDQKLDVIVKVVGTGQ